MSILEKIARFICPRLALAADCWEEADRYAMSVSSDIRNRFPAGAALVEHVVIHAENSVRRSRAPTARLRPHFRYVSGEAKLSRWPDSNMAFLELLKETYPKE